MKNSTGKIKAVVLKRSFWVCCFFINAVGFNVAATEAGIGFDHNYSCNSDTGYWKGKKIVWFGTSIPAQGYPQVVGKILSANIINEAVGSSSVRIGKSKISKNDPYGWEGLAWQNVSRSLSQTIEEKKELINNWNHWKRRFRNPEKVPDTLSEELKSDFVEWSWETKLNRHLGEGRRADLYIFDHGHNDYFSYLKEPADLETIPENFADRRYFIGAMNFLLQKILADNPRARICFIGHYENQKKPVVASAQKKLAQIWNYPLLELWSKLGWTQQKIVTTGYWKDKFTWVPAGGKPVEKTITQIWMYDDLHPSSEPAQQLIAEVIAQWLKTVR